MSDRPRVPYQDALNVAVLLKTMLAPVCERIEIAGSLRREKPYVGDVELLFVPRVGERKVDMFATERADLADETINSLVRGGLLAMRPNVNGSFTWGPKNKLAIHTASGIPVDLFSTTEENWWVSLVVRTGSKETNLALTTGAQRMGRRLNAYGCGVTESDGNIIPARSEAQVFELCGVPYREPKDR